MNKSTNMTGAFLFGAIVGAVAALLTSPASGNENRDKLRNTAQRGKQKMLETTDDALSKAQRTTNAVRNKVNKKTDDIADKTGLVLEQSKTQP